MQLPTGGGSDVRGLDALKIAGNALKRADSASVGRFKALR